MVINKIVFLFFLINLVSCNVSDSDTTCSKQLDFENFYEETLIEFSNLNEDQINESIQDLILNGNSLEKVNQRLRSNKFGSLHGNELELKYFLAKFRYKMRALENSIILNQGK